MSDPEICRLPAVQLRDRIRAREVSAVEVAEAFLTHIERVNPQLNAICTPAPDIVNQASQVDRQIAAVDIRPLQGVPVGIKDVTETRGIRTTYGSPLYSDNVPAQDALVVRRLKSAGAIIVGKTNTPEFAAGGNTFNEVFGVTRNPWNPALSAGGSTGGGAASLASCMISLAQGTDLGGSLRIPASFCGVVGLRPSPGLVPSWPSGFLWDDLQVEGPMARTAEDVALMLDVISGPSGYSPLCQPIEGRNFLASVREPMIEAPRVAYAADLAGIGIDPEIEQICRSCAESLPEAGSPLEIMDFDLSEGWQAFLALRGLWMVIHQHSRLELLDHLGPNVAGNVQAGLQVSTRELAAAVQYRSRLWERFRRFFETYAALLTPCMAVPPFPAEENFPSHIAGSAMKTYIDWIAPTFILSLAGLPVASVPAGIDSRSLPVGIQIVGPPQGEERVLQLAHRVSEQISIGLPGGYA